MKTQEQIRERAIEEAIKFIFEGFYCEESYPKEIFMEAYQYLQDCAADGVDDINIWWFRCTLQNW